MGISSYNSPRPISITSSLLDVVIIIFSYGGFTCSLGLVLLSKSIISRRLIIDNITLEILLLLGYINSLVVFADAF